MKTNKRFTLWITVIVSVVGLLGLTSSLTAAARNLNTNTTPVYMVRNVFDVHTRSAIARTGANILEVGHDYILVEATARESKAIEKLGLDVSRPTRAEAITLAFPPADSAYHDYNEMVTELQQVAIAHPDIFSLFTIGTSYQGRTIWAGKLSDNVNVDEDEPEVLLTHHQHAREHLTVEMALYTLHMLTDEYGVTQQITDLVNSREIW
ncbi:MAG: M14 family zinc carboxypeptidase, partial [Vicinamibacterales bacterium]